MDANKKGKLSTTAIKGLLNEDLAKVDTNKDGFITKEELKKAPKPERTKPLNRKQNENQKKQSKMGCCNMYCIKHSEL